MAKCLRGELDGLELSSVGTGVIFTWDRQDNFGDIRMLSIYYRGEDGNYWHDFTCPGSRLDPDVRRSVKDYLRISCQPEVCPFKYGEGEPPVYAFRIH